MTVSASGARIQGDDYQHLLVWYHALRMLLPDQVVSRIEVESFGSGNVDDLVVRSAHSPDDYFQVKYSVDASHPITSDWFTNAKSAKGQSPLQRFVTSWKLLGGPKAPPRMTLFTNRVLDPRDPILQLRDGQRATLGPRLKEVKPKSAAGKQRARWAAHVGITEVELIELLSSLALLTDQGSSSQLVEATRDRMRSVGLRADVVDVSTGISLVRSWVTDGIREIDKGRLLEEIERRRLPEGAQYGTLLVEAIDHWPWPDSADVRLDWVDLFDGSEPRARRQLKDPSKWMSVVRPELVNAVRKLVSGDNNRRVAVRGFMRLPLWFLAGVEMPDVRGHHVACTQRGDWWSSEVAPESFRVEASTLIIDQGEELAIGISVTNDIRDDVLAHCRASNLPVSRLVNIAPSTGANGIALPTAEAARGWAVATRNVARDAVREACAKRLHLFISGPAGGALLLGHFWNRVAPTVVYEDLAPGYAPTFELP